MPTVANLQTLAILATMILVGCGQREPAIKHPGPRPAVKRVETPIEPSVLANAALQCPVTTLAGKKIEVAGEFEMPDSFDTPTLITVSFIVPKRGQSGHEIVANQASFEVTRKDGNRWSFSGVMKAPTHPGTFHAKALVAGYGHKRMYQPFQGADIRFLLASSNRFVDTWGLFFTFTRGDGGFFGPRFILR